MAKLRFLGVQVKIPTLWTDALRRALPVEAG